MLVIPSAGLEVFYVAVVFNAYFNFCVDNILFANYDGLIIIISDNKTKFYQE